LWQSGTEAEGMLEVNNKVKCVYPSKKVGLMNKGHIYLLHLSQGKEQERSLNRLKPTGYVMHQQFNI
jgi:hypothetical protein